MFDPMVTGELRQVERGLLMREFPSDLLGLLNERPARQGFVDNAPKQVHIGFRVRLVRASRVQLGWAPLPRAKWVSGAGSNLVWGVHVDQSKITKDWRA